MLSALAAVSCRSASATAPRFTLAPGARMEGDILVAEIPDGADRLDCRCEAPLDLSPWLAGGDGIVVGIDFRAKDVGEPDKPWNGVKAQLRCIDAENGRARPGP